MRKLIFNLIAFLIVLSFSLTSVSNAQALQRVRGYTTKKGTYVTPHFKTSPNKTKFDNFSTKGNVNPFTGKKGYSNPFKITPKKYR